MALTPSEIRACEYCARVADAVTARNHPIRRWLPALLERLQNELDMSRPRHESAPETEQLRQRELISAREAATILNRSKRQVHRLAADLDGEIVDGRWLFDKQTVAAYAEGRRR